MLYQVFRIEHSHGYYFEVCYLSGEYYVFVERGEDLVVEKYFKNKDDALSYFESVYFDCTGELLD